MAKLTPSASHSSMTWETWVRSSSALVSSTSISRQDGLTSGCAAAGRCLLDALNHQVHKVVAAERNTYSHWQVMQTWRKPDFGCDRAAWIGNRSWSQVKRLHGAELWCCHRLFFNHVISPQGHALWSGQPHLHGRANF